MKIVSTTIGRISSRKAEPMPITIENALEEIHSYKARVSMFQFESGSWFARAKLPSPNGTIMEVESGYSNNHKTLLSALSEVIDNLRAL